jgi:tetratricopeptide (TPR) repeat protein
MRKLASGFAVLLWLSGCAANNPLPPPPPKRVVQSPESGLDAVDLVARAIPPVGGVLPVQIAVTNLTLRSLHLDAQGIRAVTVSGASVGALSPDQAIEAAGGAKNLAEALSRTYLVHVAGREKEPSRAELAASACIEPTVRLGQAGGFWLIFVCPIIIGGTAAKSMTVASSPSLQISDVALPNEGLPSGIERRGYIFLPTGNYKALEVPLKDTSTGGIETIVQQWNNAADLANTTVPTCDEAAMRTAMRHGTDRFAAREFTMALGYYQEALTACPNSAQAQFNVARAYEALGDRYMATDYYTRALQSAPSDDAAVGAQARQALERLSAR